MNPDIPYCKAYLLQDLRKYPHWSERSENARVDKQEVDGKEVEVRRELDDESIVYLHDNYVVTDGIFRDQNILFEDVTDEWKEFAHSTLSFEVPVFEPIEIPVTAEAATTESPAADPAGGA